MTSMPAVQEESQIERAIHRLLAVRRSPRAFSRRPVPAGMLASLMEAARWAPSSMNEQPWSFIVATQENPAEFETMLETLQDANRRWAKSAPALVLAVARLTHARNGNPNRHALYDLGAAVASLVFEATALGLMAHQMGGFSTELARQLFNIPAGNEPVVVIALGFPGEYARLPEDLRQRESAPRQRKPLEEFVFSGRWGEPASLLTHPVEQGVSDADHRVPFNAPATRVAADRN